MRIAIVGPGFTGATFPLAQYFVKAGHDVDCYYFTVSGKMSIESLDFSHPISMRRVVEQIPHSNTLYRYLDSRVGVYIMPVLKRHYRLEKYVIGNVFRWINNVRLNLFNRFFLKQGYEKVILIDHSDETHNLALTLRKKKIKFITTYHEVQVNLIHGGMRREVVESMSMGNEVVVHCNDIRDKVIMESGIVNIKDRMSVFRVGPFESLWQYEGGKPFNGLEPGFLLFIGRIIPYKGLKYLCEAVDLLSVKYNLRVVIAGIGNDDTLEKIKSDTRYTLINRFVENDEMVWLTRNCTAVACPYLAASQSGMIPLSMAYGKPMIATKVGAFAEVVEEGKNGYLAEPGDSKDFARAIEKCLINQKSFKLEIQKDLSWDYISKQYLDLLQKI